MYGFGVLPEHRGNGYGRDILLSSIEKLKEKNSKNIMLQVSVKNKNALKKSCRKTFTDFTLSPRYNSKKDIKKWILYSKCMANGYSIRKCAELVGISIPTSFFWRYNF
ncbi:GNAT family N-acetyltransferase [Clostridium sp. CM027]|uniref:GNAT family N-acetyltransferase n=1 Tax=Clostridium sp. CM027 TaxID=2849865 RepID=UPI0037C0C794